MSDDGTRLKEELAEAEATVLRLRAENAELAQKSS
jgi:hypothetical protein